MRVIAVIDDPRTVEKILRHLGPWYDPPACLPQDPATSRALPDRSARANCQRHQS